MCIQWEQVGQENACPSIENKLGNHYNFLKEHKDQKEIGKLKEVGLRQLKNMSVMKKGYKNQEKSYPRIKKFLIQKNLVKIDKNNFILKEMWSARNWERGVYFEKYHA